MSATPGSPGCERWSLWSTYAFLAVSDAGALPSARQRADQVLSDVDGACSRFRPDSDLTRANHRAGRWTSVDPLLVAAVRVGLRAAELTDGLVDPCLGRSLISWGYDADIDTVRRRSGWGSRPPERHHPDRWQSLEVRDDAVLVPAGAQLDLGATCKAWAADLVATTIAEELGCTAVVSLGGDVSVQGVPGEPPPAWPVQVAETYAASTDAGRSVTVSLRGGLATSTTVARRWPGVGGSWIHHLIDPRSGRPVDHGVRTVTAVGRDALSANIASTAALVLGPESAAWLEKRGVGGRIVDDHGLVRTVGAWPQNVTEEDDN